jgi:hypothetical protein
VIALVRSVMSDLMPRTSELPGVADARLTEFLVRLRREAHSGFWLGVVLGAWVYALTPLLTVLLPLPSFLLTARLRDLHARRIVSTRVYLVRQAVFLVRLAAGMCWGADPEVRARFALPSYAPDPGTLRSS